MLDSHPVRTLSHYFVGRYLGLFAAILLVSLSSVIVIETLISYDELFGTERGPANVLRRTFIGIPARYLPHLMPIHEHPAANGFPYQFPTPCLRTSLLPLLGIPRSLEKAS